MMAQSGTRSMMLVKQANLPAPMQIVTTMMLPKKVPRKSWMGERRPDNKMETYTAKSSNEPNIEIVANFLSVNLLGETAAATLASVPAAATGSWPACCRKPVAGASEVAPTTVGRGDVVVLFSRLSWMIKGRSFKNGSNCSRVLPSVLTPLKATKLSPTRTPRCSAAKLGLTWSTTGEGSAQATVKPSSRTCSSKLKDKDSQACS
mmetsp:Transcript_135560/g.433677  ORF Transcript_135560/g.433677 Transcript_135560/m.433677 type:complete len:205 (-) Transcript_135560:681-1295(-)